VKDCLRILIIKTEPRIDLLRATALLPPLKQRPGAHITWITSQQNTIILR